jgi:hypothetical protein
MGLAAVAEAMPQFGAGGGAGRATMLRFGCSQIVIDRIDPLVNPDQMPSPHLHQIVGGNAFNVSMPNADIGELATCTTCSYDEDFSNYWTANMYFKARNGSYKRVPQVPNRYSRRNLFVSKPNSLTQISKAFVRRPIYHGDLGWVCRVLRLAW